MSPNDQKEEAKERVRSHLERWGKKNNERSQSIITVVVGMCALNITDTLFQLQTFCTDNSQTLDYLEIRKGNKEEY